MHECPLGLIQYLSLSLYFEKTFRFNWFPWHPLFRLLIHDLLFIFSFQLPDTIFHQFKKIISVNSPSDELFLVKFPLSLVLSRLLYFSVMSSNKTLWDIYLFANGFLYTLFLFGHKDVIFFCGQMPWSKCKHVSDLRPRTVSGCQCSVYSVYLLCLAAWWLTGQTSVCVRWPRLLACLPKCQWEGLTTEWWFLPPHTYSSASWDTDQALHTSSGSTSHQRSTLIITSSVAFLLLYSSSFT